VDSVSEKKPLRIKRIKDFIQDRWDVGRRTSKINIREDLSNLVHLGAIIDIIIDLIP